MTKKKCGTYRKPENPVTDELKEKYVKRVQDTGKLYKSADDLNTTYMTMRNHRDKDPAFDAAVNHAIEVYNDKLEDFLDSQAAEGNPTAAIFRLKGQRPDKYKDLKQVEQTGNITVDFQMILES